ncbi:hypothetical protein ACFELO_09555 [Oceanicaulis sp. LC35]|uniref:hypothetical protein n=1 Tax=Oceanicaulis sp. LC35 TaxID=3349635 RepID=UPI003F869CF4
MIFAAISLSLLSAASQTAAQEPPSDGPVLSLPAPGQDQGLPDTTEPEVLQNAQTYAAYRSDVTLAGERELLSGADLDATMDALSQYYDGDRLVNAQIAYAALVAARNPEFIDAVRAVADYYGTETAAAALTHDPMYVTGFMGADTAGQTVAVAIDGDVNDIRTVGTRYRQAAYDLQRERWAQQRARDRQERLSALESASERLDVQFRAPETPAAAPMGASTTLFAQPEVVDLNLPDLSVEVGQSQLQPDERRVGRMLSLAALDAIEDGDMTYMDRLLDDPAVERCMQWVRLDLAQCVAAGHFKYEDSFCIAEHALNDVADCLTATRAPSEAVSN